MKYFTFACAVLFATQAFAQTSPPKQQAAEMQALQQTIISQLQAQIGLQTQVNLLTSDLAEAKAAAAPKADPKPDAPK